MANRVSLKKNLQYYKFCLYGFLKNLRFFEPFLLLFFLDRGLSFLQIGTLHAIREIGTNLLEVPSGFLADALGRRRTMIFSFLFYIVSFLFFYLFPSYAMLIVAILFYSVGEAFRTGTHKAMIFEYLKRKGWTNQRVHYYGHTRSWSQMGSAVSSLLAAAIVFFRGEYLTVFLVSILPYLVDLLLIASYPKWLDGNLNSLKGVSVKDKFRKQLAAFWITFKNPFNRKVVNNLTMHSGFFQAVKDYLQPVLQTFALSLPYFMYMENKQRTAIVIGLMYFFIYLTTSQASRHSGKVASLFSNLRKPLNATLLLGLLVGLLSGLFYQFEVIFPAVLCYLFVFLIENLRKPIGIGFFAERVDSSILAAALSAQSQAKTIWAALISVLLGFLIDTWGIGMGIALTSSFLLVVSFLFWLKTEWRVTI